MSELQTKDIQSINEKIQSREIKIDCNGEHQCRRCGKDFYTSKELKRHEFVYHY